MFRMIESCFSGIKSVSATGGFACISNPCVNGSCDQCIVSQLHEIMSIVAFLCAGEKVSLVFSSKLPPELQWLFASNPLCFHPRHFKAPVDQAATAAVILAGISSAAPLARQLCLDLRCFLFPLLSCRMQVL